MTHPEFEDPFHISEDVIKSMIEDPHGRERIQAYMESLSDQLFKTTLSSIKQVNKEWAFPHQEAPQDLPALTNEEPSLQKPSSNIEKKDLFQNQEDIFSTQVSHILSQDLPKKAEPTYTQENKVSLNPEFVLSDSIPEEKSPVMTAEWDSQPLESHIPEIQTESVEKEEPEKDLPKAKVNSEELESRYKKRQESLQDILKKKGNIS